MRKRHPKPTRTPAKPTAAHLGPGEYITDVAFRRIEDLPKPRIIKYSRNVRHRACLHCGQAAPRDRVFTRKLFDVGDLAAGRPRELRITYSQHYCSACRKYFNTDLSDLAVPRSLYTRRVQILAVRLATEDGLPYRSASWHLWRDHRVFVPFATIQNWVEAGGKKGQRASGNRLSGLGPG